MSAWDENVSQANVEAVYLVLQHDSLPATRAVRPG